MEAYNWEMKRGLSEPAYITLYHAGELKRRAEALEARLASCDICPRECGADRLNGKQGFCRAGYLPLVATICRHSGEEPAVSGSRGSGTVFFGSCNLRCIYCQNHQISQDNKRQHSSEMDFHTLAERLIYLQDDRGCHNINFVSPSHFVPQMVRVILEAVPMGLRIPVVYNSSGYDSVGSLRELEGVVSVYLPDLRYASDQCAYRLSRARNYVNHARAAVLEMYRQVGNLVLDEEGIARRGLIVRHLVLPDRLAGSKESLTWLADTVSPEVTVSIMSQYFPAHRASRVESLSRALRVSEYSEVIEIVNDLGLENGWIQEMGAADNYLPDFEREGHPFISPGTNLT